MATIPSSEFDILNRVLQPEAPMLSPDAAREILNLSFAEQDRERMAELVARAKGEELTDEERQEFESYSRVNSLLGILKSKARVSLRQVS